MNLKPSTAYAFSWEFNTMAGGAANPDGGVTGQAWLDGDTAAPTVTLTNKATGVYEYAFTTGAYTNGQTFEIRLAAINLGLTYKETVLRAVIDSKLNGDLADAAEAPSAASVASQVRTELTTELARVDATISSRNATAPDNAGIAAVKLKTDNLPTDPADQSAVEAAITAAASPLATTAALAAVAGYVDTEVAAVKAVTDKLGTAVELDGAVYRLTANALEQSPTSGMELIDDVTGGTWPDGSVGNMLKKLNVGAPSDPVIPIPAIPAIAGVARVYGGITGMDDAKRANITINFELLPKDAAKTNRIIDRSLVKAKTDATGAIFDSYGNQFVELWRTDTLKPAAVQWKYRVWCEALNLDKTFTLTENSKDISDVISN